MSGAEPAARSAWTDAMLVVSLFAIDPAGTGGVSVRSMPGPVRDQWAAALRHCLPATAAMRRLPIGIGDERLLGGLDLAATLGAGRPVAQAGVLAGARGGVVVLAMAERVGAGTAARIAQAMDAPGADFGIVALDEGEADEAPPATMLERCAFRIDLAAVGVGEARSVGPPDALDIGAARALLPAVVATEQALEIVCGAALALGVASSRAALLALRVARAAAALEARESVSVEDAVMAVRLVLGPRATRLPVSPEDAPDPAEDSAPPETAAEDSRDTDSEREPPTGDIVLEAARAAIPPDLLALLAAGAARRRAPAGGRTGVPSASALHGRPAGTRAGRPPRDGRLNVVETLRTAAPWQRVRRAIAAPAADRRVLVRTEDFRVSRQVQPAESTAIFVVDASGSAALNRLAEAKGAVELLLADCYRRRDRVAVLAFRGRTAELLLPPTRALARAKRSLAGLPGGGGTPLASAIEAASSLAEAIRRRGGIPAIVFLTDGRANIALDGAPGRPRAEADSEAAARRLRLADLPTLLVDTSPRPHPPARKLAGTMNARYLALPYADPAALSRAVRAATG